MTCLACIIATDPEAPKTVDEGLAFGFISGLYLVMRERTGALVEMRVFASSACPKHAPFVREVLKALVEDESQASRRETLKRVLAEAGSESGS